METAPHRHESAGTGTAEHSTGNMQWQLNFMIFLRVPVSSPSAAVERMQQSPFE